jgi:calcium-dependent protein kinase
VWRRQGAYGKVWKVVHKASKLARAMKSIKKNSLLKEEQERLFSEMNILKNLDHPNIVKLYELFEDSKNYYLVTEYCSGGELFDRIKKLKVFTEKKAADLMKQILGAVVYCHT